MLPKINRLKDSKSFKKIFKKASGFKDNCLYIKTLDNSLPFSRFGIVVSQKISREAVVRNKIKRKIRAIVKHMLPYIKEGKDIVIVAGKGIENKNFDEFYKAMQTLFDKAKLIKQR